MAFTEAMTAHHEGAIEMAKTQLKYGKNPEMRKLAEDIINAQQPEIDPHGIKAPEHGALMIY